MSWISSICNWENYSETIVGSHNALLKKSTIGCNISNQNITITDSGQRATLEASDLMVFPPIYVRQVEGKAEANLNENVEYKVTEYSSNKVTVADKQNIKWKYKTGEDKPVLLPNTGETITLTIKPEWTGKEIIVMPFLHSHTERVSVRTTISPKEGIIGVSKISAMRILDEIQNSFYDYPQIKNIFKLETNGLKIHTISNADLENAIGGYNMDIRSLAYAYYLAINSTETHYVDMTLSYETLNDKAIEALSLTPNTKGLQADINYGGGVNIAYMNGTLTVVVMDSKADIGDFTYAPNGVSYDRYSTPAELLAHELLGHGYGSVKHSISYGHEDAIQMSNLYWRARGYHKFYRNGSWHGTGVLLDKILANKIPTHFQK